MTAGSPDPSPLDASLRRLRFSALFALAACAAGILLHSLRADDAAMDLDRGVVFAAFALAAISILTRRSVPRSTSPRGFVGLQIASILSAVGLGLLGGVLALRDDQIQVGLLYNVAGALLLLRPPARLVLPSPRPRA